MIDISSVIEKLFILQWMCIRSIGEKLLVGQNTFLGGEVINISSVSDFEEQDGFFFWRFLWWSSRQDKKLISK